MDQSVIAGIGNIYRSEILHLLKIHPRTPGEQITRKQFDQLWTLAKRLLELGVKHNRIITIDEKDLPKNVERTPRNKLFRIFKKPHCPTCAGELEQFKLASRKVFACPRCQQVATFSADQSGPRGTRSADLQPTRRTRPARRSTHS